MFYNYASKDEVKEEMEIYFLKVKGEIEDYFVATYTYTTLGKCNHHH